jgi:hypothetical protein
MAELLKGCADVSNIILQINQNPIPASEVPTYHSRDRVSVILQYIGDPLYATVVMCCESIMLVALL